MTIYIRPSMAERSIGRVLWRWREDAGMSLSEACEKAGFSAATLSMMENSLRPFDPLNIMILGRVYDIPNESWKHEVRRAEFATIEVPMWPGITTEARRCGAFSRKSFTSASVKPFTANLAAL